MFIYDTTSLAFIQKSEAFLKEILKSCGIPVKTSRFLLNGFFYPINLVVFEGSEWGHFNAPYFQIGLNRKLIYRAKDSVIRDILKHELAHYLTYIHHGEVQAHGKEFKGICERYGFPEDIAKATIDLDSANLSKEGDLESEKILEKVKKLLSLAESSNSHEAELATLKANALLLRHNLDYLKDRVEPIYMDRLLSRKRKDSKITAIYSILKHFIVKPVISQGKDTCCLEVSGSLTNVKLAGYVASFLDRELEVLWEEARRNHGLTGLQAKNSFFLGVAEGFDEKMKMTKASYSQEDSRALTVVEQKLEVDTRIIYRRLGQSKSNQRKDKNASLFGKAKGLKLSIKNAVEGKTKNLLLSYKK